MKSGVLKALVVLSLLGHLAYLFVHDEGPRSGGSSGSSSWRSWGGGSGGSGGSGGGGGFGGFGGGHK